MEIFCFHFLHTAPHTHLTSSAYHLHFTCHLCILIPGSFGLFSSAFVPSLLTTTGGGLSCCTPLPPPLSLPSPLPTTVCARTGPLGGSPAHWVPRCAGLPTGGDCYTTPSWVGRYTTSWKEDHYSAGILQCYRFLCLPLPGGCLPLYTHTVSPWACRTCAYRTCRHSTWSSTLVTGTTISVIAHRHHGGPHFRFSA